MCHATVHTPVSRERPGWQDSWLEILKVNDGPIFVKHLLSPLYRIT